MSGHHEFLQEQPIAPSSDRTFGLIVGGFLILLSTIFLYKEFTQISFVCGSIGLALFLAAFVKPKILAGLNKAWTKFGFFLARITTPIVMAILFFVIITPFAFIGRMRGLDPLALKSSKTSSSFWKLRTQPGPPLKSMKRLF